MPSSPPIRVGLIRCDLHGIYYGALMADHDPLVLREKYGGAHFYHYTYYNDPRRITVETVEGFEIVRVWDEDRSRAERVSDILYGRPLVCDDFEQVSDDVDLVFIADCDFEGKDHLELATPGLQKGVATFVDKPFAYTVADVKQILALAREHGAPVMSLSILRSLPAAGLFARRMAEIGGAKFGTVQGGTTHLAGLIHTVSLAQCIFGDGVERVQQMTSRNNAAIHLDYGDRDDRPIQGVVINTDPGPPPHCAMYVSAYGPKGRIHSPHFDDHLFPFGAAENIKKIRAMVRSGESQAPEAQMIENVAVAEAARTSEQRGGEGVEVTEVIGT